MTKCDKDTHYFQYGYRLADYPSPHGSEWTCECGYMRSTYKIEVTKQEGSIMKSLDIKRVLTWEYFVEVEIYDGYRE